MEIKSLDGARRFSAGKMVKNKLFETPRFFLDVHCLEPGQSQEPHQHESSDKVYVVQHGRGRFQVGAEEKRLDAGQVVLAPAGVSHGVVNDGPERLVVLTFMAPHPRLSKAEATAASAAAGGARGGDDGRRERFQQLGRAYQQFAASFDRIWSVIARGEAGNLVAEALEDPAELDRAQRLRAELEAALHRLDEPPASP
ncbi:MAG TPA: cupin domain-containing protein [Acidobacteriota bacterium]